MKAAIYMGKEDIEIREIPTPECGDDDVLIKNIYSSICGRMWLYICMDRIPDTA